MLERGAAAAPASAAAGAPGTSGAWAAGAGWPGAWGAWGAPTTPPGGGAWAAPAWAQEWERLRRGEMAVRGDLEAEEQLMAQAEEALERLQRGWKLQRHLEEAVQQALRTQAQIDAAKRVLSNFRRRAVQDQRAPPSTARPPTRSRCRGAPPPLPARARARARRRPTSARRCAR